MIKARLQSTIRITIIVAVGLLHAGAAYGISDGDFYAATNDDGLYTVGAGSDPTQGCSTLPTGTLPTYIPEPYNGAFTSGAQKHNVAPALIAGLFTEENFTGADPATLPAKWAAFITEHPDPNSGWPTNQFQTEGPFQFLPSTWGPPTNLGDDGNGDGIKDPQNLADAAAGAANYAQSDHATIDTPESSWDPFIFSYNHADWYVAAVKSYYEKYNGDSTVTAQSDPTVAVAPTDGAGDTCGGEGVGANGFIFPQRTTKAQIAHYGWNPNCTNPVTEMGPGADIPGSTTADDLGTLCHHDYLAADIFNAQGTVVIAPVPGRVVRAHDTTANGGLSVGYTVSIFSDPALGGDGKYYYLAHMLKSTEGGTIYVNAGDTVKAGDQLGVVGNTGDAEGSPSHTHIDISPVDNDFSRGFNGTSGPLLDPMPVLKAAYENLPAN